MYAAGILISGLCFSQESGPKVKASFFDGIVVAGYVDHGAFINFTGPNVNFSHKGLKLIAGMLPSLRIKEDRSPGTKNSRRKRNLESWNRIRVFVQIDFFEVKKIEARRVKLLRSET